MPPQKSNPPASLDPVHFAIAIKLHRDRLGLTQPEAAAVCDVSPRTWWQWERGKGSPLPVTMEGALRRLKFATVKA